MSSRPFQRVLIANRGEIAVRIARACAELGIRSIGIYSREDRHALHRYRVDESYPLPENRDPLGAYLDIAAICDIARQRRIDAIHPGYGFLSESAALARACEDIGVVFVGPPPRALDVLGDKTAARRLAQELGVPVIPGTEQPVISAEAAASCAAQFGYPVILKAAFGGGGRGMRVASDEHELTLQFPIAAREAAAAFGRSDLFVEKYLPETKHIEVQILADAQGNVLHLFERDCSVQRRHQKVVEFAPAVAIPEDTRARVLEDAVRLARAAGYVNAGTVEFLVTPDGQHYFIEVNPRVQVEHTVTEWITGVDIVRAQIRIAEGQSLPEIGLPGQHAVQQQGCAIQCRVTTEDPANHFIPDYGRITHCQMPAGPGIRVDTGIVGSGAVIAPFYDSLIVKVSTHGLDLSDACARMTRALSELRIHGVKTNLSFLENVVQHPVFRAGQCTTRFIESTPDLLRASHRIDRGERILQFISEVIVNGNPDVPAHTRPAHLRAPVPPRPPGPADVPPPEGTRDLLRRMGPEKFAEWVRAQKRLLITDTTLRDAHQSLLATRMRTLDMLPAAAAIARDLPGLFSLEMWGGATFDTAMRFLHEDPWERLAVLRQYVPNILFQMLLRGANAVGYTNYPDNVVQEFVRVAVRNGIDLFRIFDSLNNVEAMRPAIDAVREHGAIAEGAICYSGDLFDPDRPRFHLSYYVRMARALEKAGVTMLGIKDMAGLCRPYAARKLIQALREEVGIPIHFHTHDTPGGQVASLLFAAESGVDVVDTAISALSGITSQPSMEALVAALQRQERDTGLDLEAMYRHADYWRTVREYYAPFESDLRSSAGDVYVHEIPGGQYSNLRPQAEAMGVGDRLPELKRMYAVVNQMLGDIVKVTPSSKVVGDLALFMLTHNLTPETLLQRAPELQFPDSVVGMFAGEIGFPEGGFPPELQQAVLKGRKPLEGRPGASLPPVDFEAIRAELRERIQREPSDEDVLSYLMYPRVFLALDAHRRRYTDVSRVPTNVFFYGMQPGEETEIALEDSQVLAIRFVARTEPDAQGRVNLFYELDGHPCQVQIQEKSAATGQQNRPKAEPDNPCHIGAPMPGTVVEVATHSGQEVQKDSFLMAIEAMKVQVAINSPRRARVREVLVKPGDRLEMGDLLVVLE